MLTTVEPLNNGHIGDEHFVHCSEVVPSSEVEMYGQYNRQGVNSLSIVGRLSTLQSVRSAVHKQWDKCRQQRERVKIPRDAERC